MKIMLSRTPVLIIVCFLAFVCACHGKEYYWTVKVMPGMRDCFYETVQKGTEVEAEYQVLSGGQDAIRFDVSTPDGRRLEVAEQETGVYEFTSDMTGDYEFCVDNQMNAWGEKLVFLDLGFNRDSDHIPPAGEDSVTNEASIIGVSLEKVRQLLDNVRSTQEYLRVREARHRHTADNNLRRVLMWSLCECAALVTIGCVQVFVLRKLFADTGKTSA